MSWLSNLLHPSRPYKAAQSASDAYYRQAQERLNPFFNQGQQAFSGLSGAMNSLLDPQTLMDKWSSGYQESESAKIAQEMAKQHGLDAASSMGLLGSTPALQALQSGTTQIGLQDKQNYLDNLMQKYLQGANIASNIYGIGANTGNVMSQNAINQGQNAAQLAYGRDAAGGDLFSKLLGLGAGMFSQPLVGSNNQNSLWSTTGVR